MREKERKAFSHERARSSRPLALRFFHPFFLSPPFSLSFIERLPLGPLRSSCSCPFFFLSRSLPLARSPRRYRSFSSSPSAEELLLSRWFSYSASSFFFSSFRPLILPRVAPFPSEFTPERIFLPLSHRHRYMLLPPPPFFPRPFLSLSIAVFCTLRI